MIVQPDAQSQSRIDLSSGFPMAQGSPTLVQWQLRIDDLIKPLVESWRGVYKDPATGKKEVNEKNRIMNEKGIQRVVAFIRQVSKNLILSNYDEKTIGPLMINMVSIPMISLIAKRSREFEMDASDRDSVLVAVENFVYSALLRAKDAGERRANTETNKNIQTTLIKPEEKGRGFKIPFVG